MLYNSYIILYKTEESILTNLANDKDGIGLILGFCPIINKIVFAWFRVYELLKQLLTRYV
jgi:hypothetical protein